MFYISIFSQQSFGMCRTLYFYFKIFIYITDSIYSIHYCNNNSSFLVGILLITQLMLHSFYEHLMIRLLSQMFSPDYCISKNFLLLATYLPSHWSAHFALIYLAPSQCGVWAFVFVPSAHATLLLWALLLLFCGILLVQFNILPSTISLYVTYLPRFQNYLKIPFFIIIFILYFPPRQSKQCISLVFAATVYIVYELLPFECNTGTS